MTSTANLPWNTTGTQTATSGDPQARATSLAHAAMEAAASQPAGNPADSDYGRAQAAYARDLARIRAETANAHVAANNARAEAAAAARAERQAAHQARNEAAKADAQQRRAKAA